MFSTLSYFSLSPPIRLYSASAYFAMGITALLPDAEWDIKSFDYNYSHFHSGDAAYHFISLNGCSPADIGRSLLWLQRISHELSFPALLLVDEISPLILQQTTGTNTVVIDGKAPRPKTLALLLLWVRGELKPANGCKVDHQLNAKEWGALNRYLLVQDMPAVARWMNLPLKSAYYWRKRAVVKLGFRHINEFLRYYPVGNARTVQQIKYE